MLNYNRLTESKRNTRGKMLPVFRGSSREYEKFLELVVSIEVKL